MKIFSFMCAMALGVALAAVGFSVATWQFWLIYGLSSAWAVTTSLIAEPQPSFPRSTGYRS